MRFLSFLLICLSVPIVSKADVVIGFEELTVFTANNPGGGGKYYNGNDGTNTTNSVGWSSGNVFFNNNYTNNGTWEFWSGWAYSNVRNTTDPDFTNQYASFPGSGSGGSDQYAVAYASGAYFDLPDNTFAVSMDITNTTYAALTMRDGDVWGFSKKFGGEDGTDADFFQLIIEGFDGVAGTGNSLGKLTVDLADYRFDDNDLDFILDNWLTVDLSSIGTSRSLVFDFASSDVGDFGINTPTYFAIDNLTVRSVPEPSSLLLLTPIAGTVGMIRNRRRKRASTKSSLTE